MKYSIYPWGVYIGDLVDENDSNIPFLIDSKNRGLCLLFDEKSEETANVFLENIALSLIDVMPLGSLVVDIFDFGKKRFLYLSALNECGIYNIAYNSNKATRLFDDIEELVLSRHHNLLDFSTPTLSEYNQVNQESEPFHLILINLEDFPEDFTSPKRVKNFLESAYEAGVYIIAFGSKNLSSLKNKATNNVLNILPQIIIRNNHFDISRNLLKLQNILEAYEFKYLNNNRKKITQKILFTYKKQNENNNVKNFISIPIGKIGKKELNFEMGLKSQNYHVFIAGMTGTGKTNLLNNIIVSVAQNFTAKEIEIYLMDYKPMGAEFGIFKNHPNCKKLFLDNQDPSLALDMLKEFQVTMYERGKVLNGKNIDEYNQANPNNPMPRKVLIIDEVQRMFNGEWREANEFNSLLEDIVKAGRSFGLHLILTTQSLKDVNIKGSILTQIPLKISFRLSSEMEAMKIFNDNKEAIKQAPKLKPYHFIYSDFNKTVTAKATELKKYTIEPTLQSIRESRAKNNVLTPKIVIPKNKKEDNRVENNLQKINQVDNSYKIKYNTDREKELLEKFNEVDRGEL